MPATYDPACPTGKDWVRLLVGDRDTTASVLDDLEIYALLDEEQNKYLAAARAADLIMAKRGNQVMKQVGDLRIEWSDSPHSAYRDYVKTLRERGAMLTLQTARRSFRVL